MTEKSVSHGRKSISVSAKPRELMTKNPRLTDIWTADVITLFPESFPGLLGESLIGSAIRQKNFGRFRPSICETMVLAHIKRLMILQQEAGLDWLYVQTC